MVHTCSLFICSASPPSLRRLVSAPTSHRWILIAPANFFWRFPPKGGWHLLWYSQLLCLHCLAVLSQFYVSELMGVGLHIAPPQLSKEHGWRQTERFSDSLQENAFWKGHSSFYMASTWIGLCFMHVVAILLYSEYLLEIPSGSFLALRVPRKQLQLDRFATQKAKLNSYEIIIFKINCQYSEINSSSSFFNK